MSESERGRAGRVERSESRGWSREEWTVARDRLTARGLIHPDDGTATEAGRSLRHQVERHTDQLAAAPRRFLGPDDRVMRPRGAAGVAAAALLLIAVSGCDPDTEGSAGPKENGGGGGAALAVAEALPVKGRAPKTGYDRDKFGSPWADTDSNSCDTRDVM